MTLVSHSRFAYRALWQGMVELVLVMTLSGLALAVGILVDEATVETLWAELEANPGMQATVDLVERTVTVGNITVPFEIDDYTRWRLLEGLDDIAGTLKSDPAIASFEGKMAQSRPWL